MPPPPRVLLAAVLTALLGAGALAGCAGPRRQGGAALRVATWNVGNLFDEVADGDEPVVAAADVERKLERLGAALRAIDADVVALQEVENVSLLDRLVGGPLAGKGYRGCLADGEDEREVAVLARVPSTACVVHAADAKLFSRAPLEVRVEVGGREVVVLVAHLKSKSARGTSAERAREQARSAARREAQARRLRDIADAIVAARPRALVIVAGDLNDEPASAPLAPLLADGGWVDVGARAEGTFRYDGRWERIDYLLVPRGAAIEVTAVAVPDPRPRPSDHRPVVVDLSLR